MKILLLGASGQLGTEWQYMLADKEDKYLLVPYTSDQLDITQADELEHEIRRQQPDIIINCAAYTKVDDAEEERDKARAVNAEAVKDLAEICAQSDIYLVHFSTDYIFAGSEEDRDKYPEGYREEYPANPINFYGQTKWEGEETIRNSSCRHLIMRVSWLCGAYGSNFVKTMLRLAEKHTELDVVDDQLGSPTYTNSLVSNTLKLIEQKQEGTYHYSSNGMISWADFAKTIFELANKEIKINRVSSEEFETKAKRPHFSKLCTDKVKEIDGIQLENWKVELSQLLKQIKQEMQ